MRRTLLSLSSAALFALPGLAQAQSSGYRQVWDDFQQGFTVDSPDAKWFHFSAGWFLGDDGIVRTSDQGLDVVSPGVNPKTGEPAFTKTVAPDSQSGIPGGIDHVKWLVYMNHTASSGWPGFDAVPGQALSCEAWVGGTVYGADQNPFGTVVEDPNSDLRLGSFAINSIDFETFMVFDFFVTNEKIYAFYERLPFGRDRLGNYAAFSHMIPVADNAPGQVHHVKTSYDRAAGTVTWYLDEKQVFQVDKIGYRLKRSLITLDHGGVEESVSPRQLDCGMGTFTLLDAYRPSDLGLVKLSDDIGYYDPDVGEPTPEPFFDPESNVQNRLWGQGAEMKVKRYVISSRPVGE